MVSSLGKLRIGILNFYWKCRLCSIFKSIRDDDIYVCGTTNRGRPLKGPYWRCKYSRVQNQQPQYWWLWVFQLQKFFNEVEEFPQEVCKSLFQSSVCLSFLLSLFSSIFSLTAIFGVFGSCHSKSYFEYHDTTKL